METKITFSKFDSEGNSDIMLDGEEIGFLSKEGDPDYSGQRLFSKITGYSVTMLDHDYTFSIGRNRFKTLKEARDAVRSAIAKSGK